MNHDPVEEPRYAKVAVAADKDFFTYINSIPR